MHRNCSVVLATVAAPGGAGVAHGTSLLHYRITILSAGGSGNSIEGLGFVAGSCTSVFLAVPARHGR
jgi:hypothetical protein